MTSKEIHRNWKVKNLIVNSVRNDAVFAEGRRTAGGTFGRGEELVRATQDSDRDGNC